LKKFYRLNQHIKAPEVRVINQESKQIGIMATAKALSMAREQGLDLIELTNNTTPPIVKIINFTKFKYQQNKKEHQGTKSTQQTKEVRFSPFMAKNDAKTRVDKAAKFLTSGDRVKLVVKFSGRQITRKEFGERLISQAIENLSDLSTIAEAPKLIGRLLIAQLKPRQIKKIIVKNAKNKTKNKKNSSKTL